ncbi:hypothetical protein CG478_006340 [Bacillus cytotoxicus]|nr:hypothetical protein CG483_008915 [Bacillus cytotoxicus]AWC40131.1 hypothetical protein CG480_006340 [Bacillus cytotoxicus]AWC48062.1 hypothetical protein CG478_006340 [Bacillus cytotoxicus]AWC52553.1 hypothetical protein CG477_008875 [Bacillus cytotoxicus]AWC56685.1 hypothetical protein CG476_008905 [Bacillus cytotoxicus]
MSLNEEDKLLEEDDDEGIELKTITIEEYVKQQRERRKQEQKNLKTPTLQFVLSFPPLIPHIVPHDLQTTLPYHE